MENKFKEDCKSDFFLHSDPFLESLTDKEMTEFVDMLIRVDDIYLENLDLEDC